MMRLLIIILITSTSSIASAGKTNIPAMYFMVAEENSVPTKLFFAMILRESSSLTTRNDKVEKLPWPWTVNHRGTPHYFPSRESAYIFAKSLVDSGQTSFDVGLGQINWKWHSNRFTDLWAAFDPYINLNAAAQFFREQYERPECNKWELAVGCYHRPAQRELDKKIAKNYTKRVISLWVNI